MDLPNPKKSRPDPRNDTDDAAGFRVDGRTIPVDSRSTIEKDTMQKHPRHDRSENVEDTRQPLSPRGTQSSPSCREPSRSTSGCRCESQFMIMRVLPGIELATDLQARLCCTEVLPPVTKETLSELDLERILRNPSLRTDANFEPDLHFKPDLDGEKGRTKRKMADNYWEALEVEIMMYSHVTMASHQGSNNGEVEIETRYTPVLSGLEPGWIIPRLPLMFEMLQEILKTLVPEQDHPSVAGNLDVPFLMQQVRKGVLDLVGLSTWLADLLKTHCAPMRDPVADEMVAEISTGYALQDMGKVVNGLRTLFGMLEMMKLDVANHQIRSFRWFLVEGTIPFLREHFYRRIIRGGFTTEDTESWYLDVMEGASDLSEKLESKVCFPAAVMFRGLCDMLLQFDEPVTFPSTFQYDFGRLRILRCELQNLINFDICWSALETLIKDVHYSKSDMHHLYAIFQSRMGCLLDDDSVRHGEDSLGTRLPNAADIALEIARLACQVRGQNEQDEVSDDIIVHVENALRKHFTAESPLFRAIQGILHRELLGSTCQVAEQYFNMTTIEICESQRTSGIHVQTSLHPWEMGPISMKLAHIGVLYWEVWQPLLYARILSM